MILRRRAVKATFTKVHQKGYSVSAERDGEVIATLDPAPGYDARLPHDAAHFIVEDELNIAGGVFGQLAAGGTANTFHTGDRREIRKTRKRGKERAKANKKDALFSEHAIFAAQSRWEKSEIIPDTKIPGTDIARIVERFEAFASQWSRLPIGGSVTLDWHPKVGARKRGR